MTQALTLRNAADVPEADVKALAARILNNKPLFPDDLTAQQAAELAMIALATGLDPIAGELTVSFGHPLVTLDGRIRLAVGDPAFNGIEYTRPATPEEREAFRVKDHEDMWTSCVHRKGVQFPSVGYGRAGGAYETNYLAKSGARGPELARKRSIVNALRLLFPLPRLAVPGLEPLGYVVEADVDAVTGEREAPMEPAGISPEQTRAIHAIARKSGFDTEHYREALRAMFGVDSSQELTQAQAQAAIEAFATEAEPTAEERVAARLDDPTPEEAEFYAKLNAAAAASQDEEPRFFQQPAAPANDPQNPQVTSEHDPLWQRWQQVCAEAVAWSVSPDDIPSLTLPIAQASLIECGQMLGGQIARLKLKSAREQLAARGRALELTAPQLDGLLEHHFGAGVTLATCTTEQAERAAALLPDGALPDVEAPAELPL